MSLQEFDEVSAGIPIWDWLSGAGRREDMRQRSAEEARGRRIWSDLEGYMPSEDALTVQTPLTDEAGSLLLGSSQVAGAQADPGSIAAQRAALAQAQEWARGQMTATDRQIRDANQAAANQAARGQREGMLQQMRARGMGGSGSALIAQLMGQQGQAQSRALADAQLQGSIQQRALAALGQSAQMAGQMRGQSFGEETTRRSALDDLARTNMEFRRGRASQTAQSRADAARTRYGMREGIAAGQTGQYSGENANRRADRSRQDQQNAQNVGLIGTILAGV